MRYAMALMLTASLCGMPLMVGCEKEVSHEKVTETTSGGGTKSKETTVTENPDGTVNKTTETHKTSP